MAAAVHDMRRTAAGERPLLRIESSLLCDVS